MDSYTSAKTAEILTAVDASIASHQEAVDRIAELKAERATKAAEVVSLQEAYDAACAEAAVSGDDIPAQPAELTDAMTRVLEIDQLLKGAERAAAARLTDGHNASEGKPMDELISEVNAAADAVQATKRAAVVTALTEYAAVVGSEYVQNELQALLKSAGEDRPGLRGLASLLAGFKGRVDAAHLRADGRLRYSRRVLSTLKY